MGEVVKIDREEVSFDDFWALYPRRESKKDAIKAWAKIDSALYPEILTAVFHWRKEWARQNRTTDKIKLPATWLNGECWTDELPQEAHSHASHVTAKPPESGPRTQMPEYVKAMISQLRKR